MQTTQLEQVAKNVYAAAIDRDPVSCSLLYFSLRKRRLVLSLWRQAIGHKDRALMMKFLANNFDEPRWKTAALKNAFSLMSKQRFGELFAAVGLI